MSNGRPTYATWGMNCATHFRILAEEAAHRAVDDLQNPNLGKHAGRDQQQLTFSLHAAEAVVLSVMALEAGINEATIHLNTFGVSPMTRPAGFADLPIIDKWDATVRWQTGAAFPRGNRLWQDFVTLVGLRNRFVHFTWDSEAPSPALMQHLVSRDLAIPPHPGTSWWDAAMTDRVALWATQTADEMFAELTRQLGVREDGPGWQQTWAWR